jgi:multidrug efflux pump subunit AcrB
LLISLTPGLLSVKHAKLDDGGKLTRAIHSLYESLMTRLLRKPLWVIVLILPLVLVGFLAFKSVQSGFMPTMEEGGLIVDYRALPGTLLAETGRLVRQVEAILHTLPEVQTYSRRTGLGLGGI